MSELNVTLLVILLYVFREELADYIVDISIRIREGSSKSKEKSEDEPL